MGLTPIPGEGGGGGFPLPPLPLPPSGGGGGSSSGSVAGALGSIISYVGSILGYGQSYANALLSGLASALKQIFAQIVSAFQYLAQTWLGQIVKSIWNTLKTIFAAVAKELKYIMQLFQQYEKLVRYWQQKILGPILNVIQALRKTLVLFKLFHIKQAAALDNYLSGIEGRLANIFLFYQRELNSIINAIDLIVDPFGLISEGMLIDSTVRSIGGILTGIFGGNVATLSASDNADAAKRTNMFTAASQKDYMKEIGAGGTDPDDDAIIEAQQAWYAGMGY